MDVCLKEVKMRLLGIVAFVLLSYAAPAFSQQCLHGPNEDATQKARRQAGLTFVRAINTAQANEGMWKAKKYLPLTELTIDLTKAEGFELQFTTDGKSYSLILKDTTDPCRFVYSTNQDGVIFRGYPIDFEVLPVVKDTAKK
jgi:hypothetical protein